MALARKRSKYVTYEEFLPLKQQTHALTAQVQLLTRVEVLTNDVHQLTLQVADIAEDLAELRTEMRAGFAELRRDMDLGFREMTRRIDEGHAALLSAIMQLAPR